MRKQASGNNVVRKSRDRMSEGGGELNWDEIELMHCKEQLCNQRFQNPHVH